MFKKISRCFVKSVAAIATVFALNSNAAIIKTDIVMIVDESGSMGSVQANLRNNIGLFASILSAGGIDASYALVGYGSSSDNLRTLIDFTNPAGFAAAAAGLVASGSDEDAFDAVAYALNSYGPEASSFSYRADAVKNLIIFTDEPDRIGFLSFADADALLTANNALFNAVLSGFGTEASIGPLATNHGGGVFDLDALNSSDVLVVENFVTAFANSKLQETRTFCDLNPNDPACIGVPNPVPAPGTLALFGLSIIGCAALRKKA
jgi:hypothetical protein